MEKILAQYQFTTAEIEEFMSHGLLVKCPKHTRLLQEGQTQRYIYWLSKGIFRGGYTDKKGNELTRTFFTPTTVPLVASYSSFATQTPSLSFLEALEDSEVLSWHFDYIQKLESTNIKWIQFTKKQIDSVFILRDIKEWQIYTLSSEERYSAFLKESPELAHSIPQHYIASYLGLTPEGLSRVKNRLNTQNKNIKILKIP
jgi:CRP-like cAMP-binding protein